MYSKLYPFGAQMNTEGKKCNLNNLSGVVQKQARDKKTHPQIYLEVHRRTPDTKLSERRKLRTNLIDPCRALGMFYV